MLLLFCFEKSYDKIEVLIKQLGHLKPLFRHLEFCSGSFSLHSQIVLLLAEAEQTDLCLLLYRLQGN